MKKHLFSITLACLFAAPVFAQLKPIQFNPKVGVNLSRLETDPADFETAARPGYSVGLDARLKMGKKWYLQPGIHYNVMNYELEDLKVDGETAFKDITGVKTTKIPVQLGLKIINWKVLNLRAFGGGNYYRVNGVTKNDIGLTKADFNDNYWSFNAGVGLDLLLLTLDLQYEFGQTGIFANQPDTKFNTIALTAGFKF